MKQINEPMPEFQRNKRPAKRYEKPEAVKELEAIAMDQARKKYPDIPPSYLGPRKYRDDRANDLTKCIVDYIKYCGGFATRLNSTGMYRADLKKFVPNTQRKGIPDIQAVFKGTPLYIEVKIGRDRLSPHQKKIQDEVTGSGGVFFIARNFTEFKKWFDEIMERILI